MHINIVNSSGTETVSRNILEKLYNILYGGDNPEDDTLVVDNTSNVSGTLNCNILYKYKYDLMTTDFTNLFINYNDLYLYIKDPYVKSVLLANNFGDDYGVYMSIATTTTSIPHMGGSKVNNVTTYNSEIVSFDELQYFRNVTSLSNQFQYINSQFESIDLRNITSLDHTFFDSSIRHCKNTSNISKLGNQSLCASELEEFDFSSVKTIGELNIMGTKLTAIHFGGYEDITFTGNGGAIQSNSLLETIDGLQNMTNMPPQLTFSGNPNLKSMDLSHVTGNISSNLFKNCTSITRIDMPLASGIIKESAFNGCSSLTTLNINYEAFTEIWSYAFTDCKSLTSLSFPNVTVVNRNAFAGCTLLTSISLPLLTSLSLATFSYCTALTSLSLPSFNNTTITSYAFQQCKELTTVTGISGATVVESYAFNGCAKLTSIGNIKPIQVGYGAFGGCSSLTNIDLSHCQSIDQWSFQNCSSLTSVDLSNITSIGGVTQFFGCSNLETVKWSDTYNTVHNEMFRKCSKLSSITNTSALKTVNTNGFAECNLTSLSLPNVETIQQNGFVSNKNLSSLSIPKIKYLGIQCFANSHLLSINAEDFRHIEHWDTAVFWTQYSGWNNNITCEKLVFEDITYLGKQAFLSFTGLTTIIFDVDIMPTSDGNPFAGLTTMPEIYIKDDIWGTVVDLSYYSYMQNNIHKLSEYTGTY